MTTALAARGEPVSPARSARARAPQSAVKFAVRVDETRTLRLTRRVLRATRCEEHVSAPECVQDYTQRAVAARPVLVNRSGTSGKVTSYRAACHTQRKSEEEEWGSAGQ